MNKLIRVKEQFYMKEEDLIKLLGDAGVKFSYDPQCSLCGRKATDCKHWFDDEGFYIIAKNVKLDAIGVSENE